MGGWHLRRHASLALAIKLQPESVSLPAAGTLAAPLGGQEASISLPPAAIVCCCVDGAKDVARYRPELNSIIVSVIRSSLRQVRAGLGPVQRIL